MRLTSVIKALAGLTAASALIPVAPAAAIVSGQVDTAHPSVGLIRFTTPEGRFRCSGTLIAPKVVLTAGHCTEGPAKDVVVSFDPKLLPDPLKTGDYTGYIKGVAHPDPGWDGKLQFSKQHDQGIVTLATAPAGITPSPLPPVGYMDANQGALKDKTFTMVGYGVDIGDKKEQVVVQERRFTTALLKNVGTEVLAFQINDRNSTAGGGSCFGDSGGGVFNGKYVLGDASYVNSLTCNGTGTYQRDDTPYSRAFIRTFTG